jgi:hypothetical protein
MRTAALAPVFLCICLGGSAAAQQNSEIVHCRGIADDERRLACYDGIPVLSGSPLSKYENVPLDELKPYALSYRGRLVETSGWLKPGGRYFFLGIDAADADPLPIDAGNLSRQTRESLVERCGDACEATIQGSVRPVNFTTGIVADSIIVR